MVISSGTAGTGRPSVTKAHFIRTLVSPARIKIIPIRVWTRPLHPCNTIVSCAIRERHRDYPSKVNKSGNPSKNRVRTYTSNHTLLQPGKRRHSISMPQTTVATSMIIVENPTHKRPIKNV